MSQCLADGLHRAVPPTSEVGVKLLWDDLETWDWKYVGKLGCRAVVKMSLWLAFAGSVGIILFQIWSDS